MSHQNNVIINVIINIYHRERANKQKLKLGVDFITAEDCFRGERIQDTGLADLGEKNVITAESWQAGPREFVFQRRQLR